MRNKPPKKILRLKSLIENILQQGMWKKEPSHYGILLGTIMAYNVVCGDGEQIKKVPDYPSVESNTDDSSV
jgi:hypothetical protein